MHCSDDVWISFHCSLSLHAYPTLTLTLISSGDIIWNKQIHFLAKHDGAMGSGTHPAHPYNLVSICPPVQHQGRFLLFDQPFAMSKMQRGCKEHKDCTSKKVVTWTCTWNIPSASRAAVSPYNELASVPAFHLIRTGIRVWFVCSGGSTNSSYQGWTFNLKNTKALALRKST